MNAYLLHAINLKRIAGIYQLKGRFKKSHNFFNKYFIELANGLIQ